MKALSSPSSLLCRVAGVAGLLGALLIGTPATAASNMLQKPLQVGGSGVPPNLMFTLDDSGSMWWECLPDSLCTNGSDGLEAIPKRSAVSTSNRQGTVVYDDVKVMLGSTEQRPATANLLSRRMRASAYNPLYYNPAIQYKPWLKGDGTRWPNAAPANAQLHEKRDAVCVADEQDDLGWSAARQRNRLSAGNGIRRISEYEAAAPQRRRRDVLSHGAELPEGRRC